MSPWIASGAGALAFVLLSAGVIAGRQWLRSRLAEKTSQVGIASALLSTATVASFPASYDVANLGTWLGLIPVWTAAFILVCLPEAGAVIPAGIRSPEPTPEPALQPEPASIQPEPSAAVPAAPQA